MKSPAPVFAKPPRTSSKSPHKIRIIGGSLKRTPLPVVEVAGLRPTPDRVRETLFNWLTHIWLGQFSDKSVLDLFAGSGALGFEAASRGCVHVQMVEKHKQALESLRATRSKLQLDQVRIHSHDALLVLSRMDASRFDLVMLDPPFGTPLLSQVLPYLSKILKPGGLVYIESDQPIELDPGFELLRESKAGMVYFRLFQFQAL